LLQQLLLYDVQGTLDTSAVEEKKAKVSWHSTKSFLLLHFSHLLAIDNAPTALRGAPQQVATVLAMNAATSAAVTGSKDVFLGFDPRVMDSLCSKLETIFLSHGAIRLRSPLLRPRDSTDFVDSSLNRPAEVLNARGSVLLLQEDLTVNFARAVSRGGVASSNVKRYDVNTVYHESDAGGHPNESLEATFDIIQDEANAKAEYLEAETILVLCRVMSLLAPPTDDARIIQFPPIVLRSPIWFLRLSHTRLADGTSVDMICSRFALSSLFCGLTFPRALTSYL
jgi:hypothetical protein